jgi:hypothetical protein
VITMTNESTAEWQGGTCLGRCGGGRSRNFDTIRIALRYIVGRAVAVLHARRTLDRLLSIDY